MGKTDCGHYVAVPVTEGPGVVRVPAGSSYRRLYVLSGAAQEGLPHSSLEELPNRILVEAGASVDVCVMVLPGVSAEIALAADLLGEGAQLNLSGVYVCGSDEKVAFRTDVRHVSGGCISKQVFNGIAGGHSSANFYGRIVIAPDAQKTEAYQTNRNLLLSADAVVDTKPQLEIYADDVKCSHGAAVGQLNADEQFYMRSRGVPEAEAKVLQMISFIAPVMASISDESEREAASAAVEAAVRSIL